MKRLIAVLLTAAMLCSLAACAGGKDGSLDEVYEKKAIIMGYDKNYLPMGFIDSNGTYTGFDIDLAKAVCRRLVNPEGVQTTLNVMPLSGADGVSALVSGTIDFLGNSITAKGDGDVAYSEAIFETRQVIAVASSSSDTSKAQLEGKKVAVVSDSISAEALAGDSGFSAKVTVVEYAGERLAAEAVILGEADAVVMDEMAMRYLNNNGLSLRALDEDFGSNEYCLVFSKDSKSLKKEIDKIIKELKKDGSLDELLIKWFGGNTAE